MDYQSFRGSVKEVLLHDYGFDPWGMDGSLFGFDVDMDMRRYHKANYTSRRAMEAWCASIVSVGITLSSVRAVYNIMYPSAELIEPPENARHVITYSVYTTIDDRKPFGFIDQWSNNDCIVYRNGDVSSTCRGFAKALAHLYQLSYNSKLTLRYDFKAGKKYLERYL